MTDPDKDACSERPLISVCVPMYNNASTIEQCLESILSQRSDFEIVVVDDCSSDDSVAIARKMLRPSDQLVCNEINLGVADNHIKCLNLAHGDLIQIVHGDDYLLPGALENRARFFEDASVGLAFGPRRVITEDVKWLKFGANLHTNFPNLTEYNDGLSLVRQMALVGFASNWIGEPTSVMFRREVAYAAGVTHSSDTCLEELWLWLGILLRARACFVPEVLSVRNQKIIPEEDWISRPWWSYQFRVLSRMIVDPASPIDVRFIAGLWWPIMWLGWAGYFAIKGPARWSRMRSLASLPFREFALARRLRRDLVAAYPQKA